MAVRPKRKDPTSTRPIYLPRVPAKELREAAKERPALEGPCLRIYLDGAPGDLDVEVLADQLGSLQTLPVSIEGEIVSALRGRAHSEVRDAVAAFAHRLAWARIRNPAVEEYRVLPRRGEVDQEEARLRARSQPEYEGLQAPSSPASVLYDGSEVQAAYRDLLAVGRDSAGSSYVVVTDRQLGRWDGSAGRWEPTALLSGEPVVVSVSAGEGAADPAKLASEIGRAMEQGGRNP